MSDREYFRQRWNRPTSRGDRRNDDWWPPIWDRDLGRSRPFSFRRWLREWGAALAIALGFWFALVVVFSLR